MFSVKYVRMLKIHLLQVSGFMKQYQVQCDGDSETSVSYMFWRVLLNNNVTG